MPNFTRRGFIAIKTAAIGARVAAPLARSGSGRRILTLVYDKSLGMMRAWNGSFPRPEDALTAALRGEWFWPR